MFILPFFSVPEYTIIRNTTSHLGAQFAPHAWIMNTTFVLLGLGTIISGWSYLRGYLFHRILLVFFGLALCLTAVFQHAPVTPEVAFDRYEDSMHSLFATITGFSFTGFAVSIAFILKQKNHRILSLAVAALATVLSMLMFNASEWMGIWQRLIFISSFGWMIGLFRRPILLN